MIKPMNWCALHKKIGCTNCFYASPGKLYSGPCCTRAIPDIKRMDSNGCCKGWRSNELSQAKPGE